MVILDNKADISNVKETTSITEIAIQIKTYDEYVLNIE